MSEAHDSEIQILKAARQEFRENGFAGARMQSIADRAGINKSMLHYYYRSKEKLFQQIFQEAVKEIFPILFEVLDSDLGLVPKVEKLIDTYHEIFQDNPSLPQFVLHEMNQHPDRFKSFMKSQGITAPPVLIRQIEEEIRAGTMRPIKPQEFIMNVVALCVFPFVARNMFEVIFDMEGDAFDRMIEQRKKGLSTYIFNAVKKGR